MKHLLTLAVLLSTMLGLFGAAPPVTSGRGGPNSLLTGTPGQIYVDIEACEAWVKRIVGDTAWRRISTSTNFTTLGTNEFLNGLLLCRGIESIGDIRTLMGNFVGAAGTEVKLVGSSESGMKATSGDPGVGLTWFIDSTDVLNLAPGALYPKTGTVLGGLTRPWAVLFASELSVGPDKLNVDTNGVITKIGDVDVPTPLTLTITNFIPGVSTNRLSFIGGLLVTNTPIFW